MPRTSSGAHWSHQDRTSYVTAISSADLPPISGSFTLVHRAGVFLSVSLAASNREKGSFDSGSPNPTGTESKLGRRAPVQHFWSNWRCYRGTQSYNFELLFSSRAAAQLFTCVDRRRRARHEGRKLKRSKWKGRAAAVKRRCSVISTAKWRWLVISSAKQWITRRRVDAAPYREKRAPRSHKSDRRHEPRPIPRLRETDLPPSGGEDGGYVHNRRKQKGWCCASIEHARA